MTLMTSFLKTWTVHGPAVCADDVVVAFGIRKGEGQSPWRPFQVRNAKPLSQGRHVGLGCPLDCIEASGANVAVPSRGGTSSAAIARHFGSTDPTADTCGDGLLCRATKSA